MIAYFWQKNLTKSLNALFTSAAFSYRIKSSNTQTKSATEIRSRSSFLSEKAVFIHLTTF